MDRGIRTRNLIDDYQGLSDDRVKACYAENATKLVVAVESIKGTLNLGSIIRSSNCWGAERVIYFGRRRYDRRSTVGAEFHFPVEYRDLAYLNELKKNYLVVAVENNTPEAVDYRKVWFPQKTVLLCGSEECGLSKEALEAADLCIYCPQIGSVRSMNVSVAASLMIAEYVRKLNF